MARCALLLGAVDAESGVQRKLTEFKDFLTTPEGGAWREEEIIVCGPLAWQAAQVLCARLRRYDYVLVYDCALAAGEPVPFAEMFERCAGEVEVVRDVCGEVLPAGAAEALEELRNMAGGVGAPEDEAVLIWGGEGEPIASPGLTAAHGAARTVYGGGLSE